MDWKFELTLTQVKNCAVLSQITCIQCSNISTKFNLFLSHVSHPQHGQYAVRLNWNLDGVYGMHMGWNFCLAR